MQYKQKQFNATVLKEQKSFGLPKWENGSLKRQIFFRKNVKIEMIESHIPPRPLRARFSVLLAFLFSSREWRNWWILTNIMKKIKVWHKKTRAKFKVDKNPKCQCAENPPSFLSICRREGANLLARPFAHSYRHFIFQNTQVFPIWWVCKMISTCWII